MLAELSYPKKPSDATALVTSNFAFTPTLSGFEILNDETLIIQNLRNFQNKVMLKL